MYTRARPRADQVQPSPVRTADGSSLPTEALKYASKGI